MDYLVILGETGLLACSECESCVLPSSLDSYLKGKKHQIPTQERSQIVSSFRNNPSLIQTKTRVESLKIPTSLPFYYPELKQYKDGLACQDCPYIHINRQAIRTHYTNNHDWSNPIQKGKKPALPEDTPWISKIPCQQYFTIAPGSEYFRVNPKITYSDYQNKSRVNSEDEEIENQSRKSETSESSDIDPDQEPG
jgi:hypothetical protein